MSHGPEHQIEHAEHAVHATHDPFDRRVTISIAMVAAVLACVTMLGHRAHNETLRLQGESLRAQTEGGIEHAKAANMWAIFQAQNIRSHFYKSFLELGDSIPVKEGREKDREVAQKRWDNQVKKYESQLPEHEVAAKKLTDQGEQNQKKSQELLLESQLAHHRAGRFDFGELGLQLGVVLCSLAILTRGRSFWYAGLACSLLGFLTAMSGFFGFFLGEHH